MRVTLSLSWPPPDARLPKLCFDYDGDMAVSFTPVDDDLYREIILDHYRNPRHKAAVEPADQSIDASNPLCGDEIDLSFRLQGGSIEAIGFQGRGCSISQASASMLCESVTGLPVDRAAELAEQFRAMLQGDAVTSDLGDLEALRGVRAYPVRVKCATLAWSALLEGLQRPVRTQEA
jgi:nitrogen fixation protein NifU and related proteins